MRILMVFCAAAIGLVLGFTASPSVHRSGDGTVSSMSLDLAVSPAAADTYHGVARRTARRTSRRTTRRVARRTSLPGGCIWRAPYHYCGGVYYQPIVEGGQTVYIVVNP